MRSARALVPGVACAQKASLENFVTKQVFV